MPMKLALIVAPVIVAPALAASQSLRKSRRRWASKSQDFKTVSQ